MSNWYAVYCKPQQDARAEKHLRNQSYEVFRPLVRVRRRYGARIRQIIESMFPRYLFIRLDELMDWAPIRSTCGVANLVRMGAYVPQVPETVIGEIRQRVDCENCINIDYDDSYRVNDRVRITEGPLAGYEALFEKFSGKERVTVLLEIMNKAQHLVLSEHAIECA
ncbi:MAG: transcription/translation regulatory transformer protein RfaH [Gammaproteobacteria bacterium]|nr:transcription/translation regulatory transformer protein RfaH [Gammaproteobacteria bacterium]